MSRVANQRTGVLIALVLALVFLVLIQASGRAYFQGIIINLGMYIILVVSLNLSNGFTGVFSLGHIGFMALGAYISAILTLPLAQKRSYLPKLPGWLAGVHFDAMIGPFPLGFLAAMLIAGLIVTILAIL